MSSIAILGLALLASTAQAHVTANPPKLPADSYGSTAFRIGHGCSGSPTVGLTIQIPEGVTSAKGRQLAGWTVSTTSRAVDATTNVTTAVTWTAQQDSTNATAPLGLVEGVYQDFDLYFKTPALSDATKTIYFPTTQICANMSQPWTDIPVAGQPEPAHPAPALNLTAKDTAGASGASAAPQTVASTLALIAPLVLTTSVFAL
ncbi:hypothetical protein BJ684DRAFT_20143 [Piptocephalis cylindrospora]|uniref:YncI copper-binding domain-containing protein n=1 Tax=Piptocephalis cylindrospora TaxID=1907219 RepID=A0A4P9Y364_9FUNG|nr:hypothetical protein BJ684DRAFT_20143 [Piptocephalis cylindrospora]|eukprot:RKP13366.1 hypothetical protein BJ684DRAFT_20143 [Piptocephalis cylindrospora]